MGAGSRICGVCGLSYPNSMNVPVFRYTLLRSVYQAGAVAQHTRTRSFGQIGVCDRCLGEQARLTPLASSRIRSA